MAELDRDRQSQRQYELLVLSDTHGRPDKIREVLARREKLPGKYDAILFLGDGVRDFGRIEPGQMPGQVPDLFAVRGNCDFSLWEGDDEPEERMVDFGGVRILLMHGHRFGVKSGPTAAALRAAERGADLLLFGHTHRELELVLPAGEEIGGRTAHAVLTKPLILFNPGSLGEGDSFGVVTIRDGQILCSHGSLK